MNRLIWAALPALLGSLFLMHRGGAGQVQVLLQLLTFCAAAALAHRPLTLTERQRTAFLAVAALALLLPLLLPGAGPHRWLGAGGFRLYIASAVLPSTLLLVPQMRHAWGALLVIAAALVAQPDASQATVFALAGLVVLLRAPLPWKARVGIGLGLLGSAVLAWSRPDPLQPVSYVEGVLVLAQHVGPLTLGLALIALALPLVAFVRAGHLAVAVYYAAVMFFAYRQLTPMPLLGFGVGPILGYFGAVTLAKEPARPVD